MDTKKNLYPIKFIPVAVRKPWGGNALIKKLGKQFTECDDEGNETILSSKEKIGESWEIADMGFIDSTASNGWLAGNTFEDIMETYIERISGENVYQYFGRQFPVLVKFLDIQGKTSVQTNPDDEAAEQRYDALGKAKMWHIMEAAPEAKIYLGFKEDVTARDFYNKCLDGSITEIMNIITPKAGDSIFIKPGTVHCAEGGLLVAEIQESSDLTFRLYDWDREFDADTARPMHLEEAFDLVDMTSCDPETYIKHAGATELFSCREFTTSLMELPQPVKIADHSEFLIYVCVKGAVSVQTETTKGKMESISLKKGESILIPADVEEFFIVPAEKDSTLLEVAAGTLDEEDSYIDPNTEPFLEGEDYEGLDIPEDQEEEEE